jgi:hypothetical protein
MWQTDRSMPAPDSSTVTTTRGAPYPPAERERSRAVGLLVTATVVLALLATGAVTLDRWASATEENPPEPDPLPVEPVVPAAVSPDPGPSVEPTEPPPVLSLSGDFPTSGPGVFAFAEGRSRVLGESGPLLRFRVAVEDGIDEDADEFGDFVAATLGDDRSWTAGGDLRLRRVPEGAGHDFTVYLATRDTTARMCAETGLEVIGSGLPEGGVSCRTPGRAIINYTRWRRSVPHYVDAEVPLRVYRQMVVNHEVGHELGHGHSGCPGKDEPAPVMQQQTIFLDGCVAYPWPYRKSGYYAGVVLS